MNRNREPRTEAGKLLRSLNTTLTLLVTHKYNKFVSNDKISCGVRPEIVTHQTTRSPYGVEVFYETGQATSSITIYLGRVENRLLKALMEGPATAAQLCERAGVTDPRGHISRLRRKGIPIVDYWVDSGLGTKCKVYKLEG